MERALLFVAMCMGFGMGIGLSALSARIIYKLIMELK